MYIVSLLYLYTLVYIHILLMINPPPPHTNTSNKFKVYMFVVPNKTSISALVALFYPKKNIT